MNFVFDVDGTLVDTRSGVLFALQIAFETVGVVAVHDKLRNIAFGPPLKEILHDFIIDEEVCERAEEVFRFQYDNFGIQMSVVYPNIAEILIDIRETFGIISFFSNNNNDVIYRILRRFDLFKEGELIRAAQVGDKIISKDEVLSGIIRELGFDPEDGVVVGDTQSDFNAAQAHGLRFVGAGYGYKGVRFLKSIGVRDVAASPKELRSFLLNPKPTSTGRRLC
jgi:phosphoglycolate phosphatase